MQIDFTISLKDWLEWEVNLFLLSVILIAMIRAKSIEQTIRLVICLDFHSAKRAL